MLQHGRRANLAGRTVNGKLGCGDGMNGGHKTFFDAEIIVDNLLQEVPRQLVVQELALKQRSCRTCIPRLFTPITNMGVASFAGAEMTTFFAAYEMLACEFGGGELTGGFNNVFCAAFTPGDLLGIHAVINADSFAVDKRAFRFQP